MMRKTIALLSTITILLGAANMAFAAVSAQEAARLGKDLTPMGAEKAGNADGTIPEWTGGLTGALPGWPNATNDRPNPFAGDKVLFTITAANVNQYADKLPAGVQAMLKTYPEAFKMNVYPTRRSAAAPQWVYDNIKKNATTAKITADGYGVTGAWGGVPFPIPQSGVEAIWNHMLRFQGVMREARATEHTVYANGSRVDSSYDIQIHHTYNDPNVDPKVKADGIVFKYNNTYLTPARLAGDGILAIENMDPVNKPRKAWTYDPGERRVRRAPNLAFDTPDRAMVVYDDFDSYSGSTERYNWKLVGKQEMYVPYNNNELNKPGQDSALTPGYLNSDLIRYELHRVWVVEANLREDKRHIYPRRIFYIDEDSWVILFTEKYDGKGDLWRLTFNYPVSAPEVPVFSGGGRATVDLKKDGYYALDFAFGKNTTGWVFMAPVRDAKFYTPAALRRRGR